tara:strand:+ start:94 stop:762 length:669 start_codon:yes stop_codon:yes gene_type:complete
MPVSKDFRVKKGLVVGGDIDATSGNLSAINITATGTLTAASFSPAAIVASQSVSSVSISADNFYGNITDATYSDLTIAGTTSAAYIMLDSGTTVSDSDEWSTGGVTLHSSYANVGDGSTAALFTIPMAKYRSGKCLVQAVAMGVGTNPNSSHQEVTELLFIHNGSEVNMIEYATVGIGSTTIATYAAGIDSTNVVISATAASPSNNVVQFVGTITQLHTTQV